ncbi:MAG: hypothetical protein JWN43_1256 [Gammaproteobacteria bacterium]|nr:hypothetical protein [Gammaproteobacteria bacterium]
MDQKHSVAVAIALQTHVLRTCPLHNELFCDDEADASSAFALAVELMRQHTPYVEDFRNNTHELTDLLSETIAAAPEYCPQCLGATEDRRN